MQPDLAREASQATQIGRFARYVLDQGGRRTFLALGFLVLGSLTEGISILLLVPVLQLVGSEGGETTVRLPTWILAGVLGPEVRIGLLPVLGILVLLVFGQSMFTRFKNVYMAELLYDVINRLRISLFESIGQARWSFIARIRGADLHHAVTADIDRVQTAAFHLLLIVQGAILLLAYLAVSWLISPAITLFAFVTGGAVLAALYPIRRRASRYGRLLTENRQEQYRTVYEFLTGIKVAKAFNAEPRYLAELSATLWRMRTDYGRFVRLSSTGGVVVQVASAIVLASFVYGALVWFALPLPELVVLVFLFLRVLPRFTALQGDFQQVLVNVPAFYAMERMGADCDREREKPVLAAGGTPMLRRDVRFDNVTFRYSPDAAESVVADVSFTVPARQITALIGPSGSGKTTIADLLMGLLEPDAGTVAIDGIKLTRAIVVAGGIASPMFPRRASCSTTRSPPIWPLPLPTHRRRRCGKRCAQRRPRRSSRACPTGWRRSSATVASACRVANGSGSRWPGRCSAGRNC